MTVDKRNSLLEQIKGMSSTIGLLIAIAGPAITFYTITKVENAQQELRITMLEKRVDKQDEQVKELIDKLGAKMDAQTIKITDIEKALIGLGQKIKP